MKIPVTYSGTRSRRLSGVETRAGPQSSPSPVVGAERGDCHGADGARFLGTRQVKQLSAAAKLTRLVRGVSTNGKDHGGLTVSWAARGSEAARTEDQTEALPPGVRHALDHLGGDPTAPPLGVAGDEGGSASLTRLGPPRATGLAVEAQTHRGRLNVLVCRVVKHRQASRHIPSVVPANRAIEPWRIPLSRSGVIPAPAGVPFQRKYFSGSADRRG